MVAPHVEVRQELEKQTDAAERASYKARALLGLYSDPAGVRMIQRQTQALKEQASFAADAARLRRRVEIGGFAEGMENAQKQLGKVQAALEGIARQAGVAFAVMSAGIGAAVRSASPAHWDTLRGSVQLLGGAIGQAFLPAAKDMAGVLQRAAAWVRGLDDGLKSNVGKILLWTAGAVGVVAVGAKIVALLISFQSNLISLGRWMGSVGGWAAGLNPWIVGLGTVAALALQVALNLEKWKKEVAKEPTLGGKIGRGATEVGADTGTLLSPQFSKKDPGFLLGGFVEAQNQLMLDMGNLMPRPGFHTGAEYGEALQLASLQGEAEGDLAAQRHRDQMEALERLLGERGLLKGIDDHLDDLKKNLIPAWR
jgi:hypothetical protein